MLQNNIAVVIISMRLSFKIEKWTNNLTTNRGYKVIFTNNKKQI